MRILIVTQDEPFYIPVLISKFTSRIIHPTEIFLLSGVPYGFNKITYIKRLFDLFGIFAFLNFGFLYFYQVIIGFFSGLSHHSGFSLRSTAKKKDIALFKVKNINNPEIIKKIRSFHPNIIISIASPQVFKKELILSADHVINIHAALLPQYRGMMPCFWVLAKGEEKTGVTIHYIDANIDTGPILLQKEIIIDHDETFHSLNTKVAEISSEMLIEVIHMIETGNIVISRSGNSGSYFSFPSKETAKEFRSRGRKII